MRQDECLASDCGWGGSSRNRSLAWALGEHFYQSIGAIQDLVLSEAGFSVLALLVLVFVDLVLLPLDFAAG